MAAEIRCRWCRAMIIEQAAAPWRYSCDRCRGRESSTGVIAQPDTVRYQKWLSRPVVGLARAS